MACNPSKIIAALHEEKDKIRDIVYEKIEVSDRMVLRMIPDGGVVSRDSNQETIIYGEARQASVAYREKDHDPKALVSDAMTGKETSGKNGLFTTNVNDIEDNACHGFCTIQFGQGFRRRGFKDYDLDLDTPIKCARELDRQGRSHIEGYFEGFRRQFTKFGLDNFSDNLLNLVIQNGEANASVLGANQFSMTAGGFQAPPSYRISVHFLEDYREEIMARMEGLAMEVSENFVLDVEMPQEDWFDAVREHIFQRYSTTPGGATSGANFNLHVMEDPEHPMKGRKFHQHGDIRCFFNSRPIRGAFKPVGGTPTAYEFIRVNHWKNEVGEEGGLVLAPNTDCRRDIVTIDGVQYPMNTLIPHIHPKSFKRYGLLKPIKPMGEANMGVNYDVQIVDGAYIPNNVQKDKFGLAARHEFRFKTMYPELSGFIAARYGRRTGYAIAVAGDSNPAAPESFERCDLHDPVTVANCDQCGETPTSEGDCVAAALEGTVGLEPCPAAFTIFDGTASTVTLMVRRYGDLAKVASVNYLTTNGTALAATHYTDTNGTLNFVAGQEFAEVTIPIIEGSTDIDNDFVFTLTLNTPVGLALAPCVVTTITIEDVS